MSVPRLEETKDKQQQYFYKVVFYFPSAKGTNSQEKFQTLQLSML